MKKNALIAWCLVPLGFLAFHFSYGVLLLSAEESTRLQRLAQSAEKGKNYKRAVELYLAAEEAAHPRDGELRARMRIDAARALTMTGAPLEAAEQMDLLLQAEEKRTFSKNTLSEARATLGMALYYAAYALRLESPVPTLWRSEADEATRIFRGLYLAEIKTAQRRRAPYCAQNLEASILLTRSRRAEIASQPVPPAVRAALDQGVASKKNVKPE